MKNNIILLCCCFLLTMQARSQALADNNKPSKSNTMKKLPKNKSVLGIFEGRPPCLAIAKQLKIPMTTDCIKLKWRLTLYRDTVTLQPAMYKLEGSLFPNPASAIENKWVLLKGTPNNPKAEVYQLLSVNGNESLYLLKGDENVLFILDENKDFRTGNADFSYTLNRVIQ